MNPAENLIDQIRSGEAPQNIREYAAQGLLPIAQEDLVAVQFLLLKDPLRQVADEALASLKKVPEDIWVRVVDRKDPVPDLIRFVLNLPQASSRVKEQILLNATVSDEIFSQMASMESGRLVDIILNNHVRLLRHPAILSNLETNPSLTADQKRRIDEFKTEFILKKKSVAPGEIQLIPLEDLLAQIPDLDADAQKWIKEIDQMPQERPTDEQVEQAMHSLFPNEELQNLPPEIMSAYQRVLQMTHGEKVRVALLGNKEERTLLIRDHSRQVASLVLRNPKLTESEMDAYSQMRNIDSDLLRQMGMNRAFIKRYSVILSLSRNPKTPSSISINLLKLLREADLRNLERDKNIPDVIRRQAKRLREQREVKKN